MLKNVNMIEVSYNLYLSFLIITSTWILLIQVGAHAEITRGQNFPFYANLPSPMRRSRRDP